MKNIMKEQNFQSEQNLQQKEILSFKEALVYLDVSESLLYKLTSNRALTFYKPNGGKLYFKKSDLHDWMTKNEIKSILVLEDEVNNYLKERKDGKKIN
ncbi:helix-turn-helix domain-containing protein [Flavobacterium sp.]|uniref:helix-turn-helix domain-containing protein n=1 Tax=Flavobacterium sp. TaxID=239 RepID=UPI003D12F9FE